MAKLTLTDIANLQNETTAVAAINANNAAIEAALENTLSRDGTSPNGMTSDFDMNGRKILNLPAASSNTEPVRKAEFDAAVGGVNNISADVAAAAASASAAAASAVSAAASAAAASAGTVADNGVTTIKIVDDNVTNAKLANMATRTIKARKTGSTGDPEDCTLSEVLDFITSAAQGDILYRGASAWARLGAGTAGQILQTNGTGANPSWATPVANPTGTIIMFADDVAPTGYLECDGAAVSRTTYATLFALVGTTWGSGDGSTTFNLPDMRGEFVRGWDHGRGVDSGRSFASAQSESIGPHNHTATTTGSTSSSGDHTHTLSHTQNSGGVVSDRYITSTSEGVGTTNATTSTNGAHTHTLTLSTTVNNNSGTENRPRNKAVMFCIKT